MIRESLLLEKKKLADEYMEKVGFSIQFDHYGIKATKSDYRKLKEEVETRGKIYNEVFFHDKHILTGALEDFLLEISEPNPNELIKKTFVEHIAYSTSDLKEISAKLSGEIISKFDVKNTHGIKIAPKKKLIIEIRNNNIIESIPDFID